MYKYFSKPIKFFIVLNIALYLFFTNCTNTAKKVEISIESEEGIKVIDIMGGLSENQKINLSTVASGIEYCVLETNEKCLVSDQMNFYCTKDYIVTIGMAGSNDVSYVFERKTGNFVRQISRYGQGSGEYTETISSFWDGDNEQICLWGNMQYQFYNLDGTLSHKARRFKHSINNFISYNDFYVGFVSNPFGNSKTRIAFYDKTGVLFDSIPEYRTWSRTQSWYAGSIDGWIYLFRNDLFYKDIYCDTVYQIKDFTLLPRYVFDTGGKTIPYKIQEGGRYDFIASLSNNGIAVDRYENYIYLLKIFESDKHLYFLVDYRLFEYPVLYDKAEGTVQIMPPVPIPPMKGRDWKIPLCGFENDLDGGLPFWPKQMVSDREMMQVYTAEELLELDSLKITDKKLKHVLNRLEIDSNPVVAIVTLKD